MTDDDSDVPVEAVDTDYDMERIELRIRGPRGGVLQIMSVMKAGVKAIKQTQDVKEGLGIPVSIEDEGKLSGAYMAGQVLVDIFEHDQVDIAKLGGVPDGMRVMALDDIPEVFDVDIVEVSDDDDLHNDVNEVVVKVDGEERFRYYKADGGIDVIVDPVRTDGR